MVRFARVLAWVLAAAVVAAPLSAALYTVKMKNGTTFETRYEPEDASWDKEKMVLLDEWGNQISLARADVESVISDVSAKGFGRMIDNTTIALGWAPNDAEEPAAAPSGVAEAAAQGGQQQPNFTQEQFVEPDQLQGIPASYLGYPSTTPNTQPAPAPAPAPAPPPSGMEK